jgi:tetratricopeptide (TPR) repeat protein
MKPAAVALGLLLAATQDAAPRRPKTLDEAFEQIDAILKLPDEKIDLALASTIMAAVLFPEIDVSREMALIDALAERAKPVVEAAASPREKARALARFVDARGYGYAPAEVRVKAGWESRHRWLHQLLETKQGHCASLSLLYLALGDRTGFPLSAVIIPDHVFVRFGNGSERESIETTDQGKLTSDSDYFDRVRARPGQGPYFKPLSRRRFAAVLLSNHLGHHLGRIRRPADALRCNDMAIEIFPELPEAWSNRGVVLRELRRPAEAVQSYDRALRLYDDAAVWSNLGNAMGDLGKLQEALASFDRAITLDPKYAAAHDNKAVIYQQMGRPKEAMACVERALEVDPGFPRALLRKASLLGDAGRHEEALRWFDRALERDPGVAVGWFNRGNSLAALSRLEDADKSYDRALALDPKYVKAWFSKGQALASLRRLDPALEAVSVAVQLAPLEPSFLNFRARIRSTGGDHDGAIADLEKSLKLRQEGRTYSVLAWVRERKGDFEGALRDCERALELSPRDAGIWSDRGTLRTRHQDLAGALADFDKAVEIDPGFPNAMSGRALVLAQMGKNEEAIKDAEKAIRIDAKQPYYAYAARGLARLNTGKAKEALEDFRQFESLASPEDPLRAAVEEWKNKASVP